MQLTERDMCAVLLGSDVGIDRESKLKPFTVREWNLFLEDLRKIDRKPEDLFSWNEEWTQELQWSDPYAKRVRQLISRGAEVGFALNELENAGIHIITVFDSGYPVLLKKNLPFTQIPPLFYYAGNLELAHKMGIAVTGSRNVDQAGMDFTGNLVGKAASEKLIVYAGGARGVDNVAETTALANGSACVSYVAGPMLNRIRKRDVIQAAMAGRLLLLSDYPPSFRFTVGRAMGRNKYIYASSCAAFVVEADYNKGGTWAGAKESIQHCLTRTYIWDNKQFRGNAELIRMGGIPYIPSDETIMSLITSKEENHSLKQSSHEVKKTGPTRAARKKKDDQIEGQMDIFHMNFAQHDSSSRSN